MATSSFFAFALLSTTIVSGVSGRLTYFQTYPSKNENNEVVYEYRYSVDDQSSGVINDRWEHRIGQFVKGSYSLLEPSGKVRSVSYEVDGARGFVAVVKTSFPGLTLQSTQQLYRASNLYPEPPVNLRRDVPPPTTAPSLNLDPDAPPPNYHAIAAQRFSRAQPPQQGFHSGFQGGGHLK